jgi:DNA-binding CsgD family transcriptional regulator
MRMISGSNKKSAIEKNVSASFKKVKEELDVHLSTINDNTTEIEANYEYLCKLEEKIDKLNEKIEQVQMMIATASKLKSNVEIQPLSLREQEVFLALYLSDGFVRYSDIAKRLGLTEPLVRNYATNLIQKGVPIIKKYQDKETFLTLEPDFRNLQTKENVLKINEEMLRQFRNDFGNKIKEIEEEL